MIPACEKCGLLESSQGPVPDDGGDYAILACGESPGENEDIQGIPFIGKSGQKLRDALKLLGYPMNHVTFTNIVKCRPPDNKLKTKHIKCCYQSLDIRDNTRLVLLLGNTPLKAVLGETGITSWNGVLVERDGIIYAPVYHPAYFLYSHDDRAMEMWLDALDRALRAFHSGVDLPPDYAYEYVYPVSLPEVDKMCEELLKSPRISFDTEFVSLDPYREDNKILAVSFANDKKGWALTVDHPKDLAPASDTVVDMICNTLEAHPYVVGHNIKMDQMQINVMLGCDFQAKGDTMLASFLLESKKGIHGLKRLAGFYLGWFEYDSELGRYVSENPEADPKAGGNYGNVPIDLLLRYAAKDAIATYQLEPLLLNKLSKKQRILYEEMMMPVSNSLYRMQVTGMAVDHAVADRYRRLYSFAVERILDSIEADPMVKLYVEKRSSGDRKFSAFNPGSWQQKAVVLYGTGKHCKWLAGKHRSDWEYYRGKYYGLKPLGLTDAGNPSTARGYIEKYRTTCPLVDSLVMYGMLNKMLGTYILPVATGAKLSGDGRARSSFNQHIVETGRISSSSFSKNVGFNQQNIPVPEKEPNTILAYQPIKNMFTHTHPGGCILDIDYSGMELRVFASLAKCWEMLEILESDVDFHTMVSAIMRGKKYEAITKAERHTYKSTNFVIMYRGDAYTLEKQYGIERGVGEKIIAAYFLRFPEVPAYQDECVRFAKKYGYIEAPFGNRRPMPDINASENSRRSRAEREAVNAPTQGGAGMTTLISMTLIERRMRELNLRSMLINTVHDDIVTDVYPGELDAVVELQVDIMENVVQHASVHMPNLDFKWLICSLKADVEVGSHYGSLEHYTVKEE